MKRATPGSMTPLCRLLATAVTFILACTGYSYSATLDRIQPVPISYSFVCPEALVSVEATAQRQHLLVDLHALASAMADSYHSNPVATLAALSTALSIPVVIYMMKDRVATWWNNLAIQRPVTINPLDTARRETSDLKHPLHLHPTP